MSNNVDTGLRTVFGLLRTIELAGERRGDEVVLRYARAARDRVRLIEADLATERRTRPSLSDYTPED